MNKMVLAASLLLAMGGGAKAQQTESFPEGAEPLTAEALRSALAGKTFTVQSATGSSWLLDYRDNGDFFIHAGRFNNHGTWRTEESRLCQNSIKITNCNEMRLKDGLLHMLRSNGEVVVLKPR
ncbi:hypothetical protein [Ottowia oryzae]|uniref:DUF995 domain-containing protein n=1 Tax=Ottowia oryzae TaxID=2109914 RepID=A0A2S0MDK1_9BURK|nr:hypothetical protein [Ottowia oryzae]AVO33948.1 hypothetical protein C6570_06555 [Ottowia oryzae]